MSCSDLAMILDGGSRDFAAGSVMILETCNPRGSTARLERVQRRGVDELGVSSHQQHHRLRHQQNHTESSPRTRCFPHTAVNRDAYYKLGASPRTSGWGCCF